MGQNMACGEEITYRDEAIVLDDNGTLSQLREAYEPGEGRHWFDPDTLAWFGSRDLDVIMPGFTIERQTKAPEGLGKWKVTVWENVEGRPHPVGGCRHDTERQARACAWATSKQFGGE